MLVAAIWIVAAAAVAEGKPIVEMYNAFRDWAGRALVSVIVSVPAVLSQLPWALTKPDSDPTAFVVSLTTRAGLVGVELPTNPLNVTVSPTASAAVVSKKKRISRDVGDGCVTVLEINPAAVAAKIRPPILPVAKVSELPDDAAAASSNRCSAMTKLLPVTAIIRNGGETLELSGLVKSTDTENVPNGISLATVSFNTPADKSQSPVRAPPKKKTSPEILKAFVDKGPDTLVMPEIVSTLSAGMTAVADSCTVMVLSAFWVNDVCLTRETLKTVPVALAPKTAGIRSPVVMLAVEDVAETVTVDGI
mmetsp:Transcript_1992/g.2814  ORF Transcript_1992/g.2814 Transcript_1992/m.2814 type:complete len:306 (-) Transcript_1992:205-1122(-)